MAGVTTSKKFVCTRQAKTPPPPPPPPKSTGQLQRDWLEPTEEQHDELVLRWPTKSYCPQRVTSLTTWNARLTETAEALKPWWPGLKQSLVDSNDHRRKVKAFDMFFASNKLKMKRGERITDYISRFEEGIKTLQDNDINLLTIDDVPSWMLMRKASLTQERRERLIAALPDEHFAINDVKRVMVRLFPEVHINEHRESDGYSKTVKKRSHWTLVSVSEKRTNVVPTSLPQCPRAWSRVGRHRQCWWWNRCEFCRSPKFCAKRTGSIVSWNWRLSQRPLECFHSRGVLIVGECGNGTVLCPGHVGNHTSSPRQDEGQKRKQKWTCSLIFWKGQEKVAKTQLSQTNEGQISCEKVKINLSRVWTTWSLGWWSSMPSASCYTVFHRSFPLVLPSTTWTKTSKFVRLTWIIPSHQACTMRIQTLSLKSGPSSSWILLSKSGWNHRKHPLLYGRQRQATNHTCLHVFDPCHFGQYSESELFPRLSYYACR